MCEQRSVVGRDCVPTIFLASGEDVDSDDRAPRTDFLTIGNRRVADPTCNLVDIILLVNRIASFDFSSVYLSIMKDDRHRD